MNMKTWLSFAFLAFAASACVSVDHRGDGDSTISVDWTIDGTDDPDQCDESGASYAEVTVETRSGYSESYEADCDAFGLDVDVPAGRYYVTVVLLDRHHDDRTSAVDTDSIDLGHNDSDSVSVDFGPDSFF
jgi:hypothetical protein